MLEKLRHGFRLDNEIVQAHARAHTDMPRIRARARAHTHTAHTYTCTHAHMHAHACPHEPTCTRECTTARTHAMHATHICTHASTHATHATHAATHTRTHARHAHTPRTYACTHACTHTGTHVRTRTRMTHACMHTRTYAHTHMRVYTHTSSMMRCAGAALQADAGHIHSQHRREQAAHQAAQVTRLPHHPGQMAPARAGRVHCEGAGPSMSRAFLHGPEWPQSTVYRPFRSQFMVQRQCHRNSRPWRAPGAETFLFLVLGTADQNVRSMIKMY